MQNVSIQAFQSNVINAIFQTFNPQEKINPLQQFTVFFNSLHTKSLLVTQFLKPDTQTPEPHTKSAKPYTNSRPLTLTKI